MAIASLEKVREVKAFAVTQIPRSKILMGIPNYGYDWTLPFVEGKSKAENVSLSEAAARAKRTGATVRFDETAQSPHYEYADAEGRRHVVWFEDARSMRARLALTEEYGLAGVGIWNVMNPWPAGQEVLREMFTVAKVE
jgi:spore germination protein